MGIKRSESSTATSSSSSSSSSRAKTNAASSLIRLPTIDIADRLNAMLGTERQPHYQCCDYLRRPSSPSSSSVKSSLSSRSRSKIAQWLYDCVDYLEVQRECVAIAMGYVDRFMSLSPSSSSSTTTTKHHASTTNATNIATIITNAKKDVTIYQLLAISALFLAAKQSNKLSPLADNGATALVNVSHGSYTIDEIIDMEQTLVTALEWRLCGPTALVISYHVIALLAKVVGAVERQKQPRQSRQQVQQQQRSIISSVVDFTRLQIELSISDYKTSVIRSPSTIALASVLNSMELLDFACHEKRAFARTLLDVTTTNITNKKEAGFGFGCGILDVHSKDVNEARMELHEVFDRQSNDIMGRAAAAAATSSTTKKNGDIISNTADDADSLHQQSMSSSKSPDCVAAAHVAVVEKDKGQDDQKKLNTTAMRKNSKNEQVVVKRKQQRRRERGRGRRAQPSPTCIVSVAKKLEP